jgi:ribosomal RNA-processing protein 9
VAESKGKMYKHVAGSLSLQSIGKPISHKKPVTCLSHSGSRLYTACKEGIIEAWNIEDVDRPSKRFHINRCKDKKALNGHTDDILSMTLSGDGKYLATGGADKRICIWDTETMTHLKTFTQHRGPVLVLPLLFILTQALACRLSTNQLYSASSDRTIKLWSLNDLIYIETLFGHQDVIPAISSFTSERCVSVGARDRSARVWKIEDESQLVYQIPGDSTALLKEKVRVSTSGEKRVQKEIHPEGSMDCVAVIDEQHFITGSDNGDIILWALNKKRPQFIQRIGHGLDEPLPASNYSAETFPDGTVQIPPQPRWITSLASVPYTDLFFSGSWDGKLGMWKVSDDLRKFELLQFIDIGVQGVINGISVEELGRRGTEGIRVALAVGTECRLGRWKTVKGGKNCSVIFNYGFA